MTGSPPGKDNKMTTSLTSNWCFKKGSQNVGYLVNPWKWLILEASEKLHGILDALRWT